MFRKMVVAGLAASAFMMGTAGEAHAKAELKMATLAPPRSPWGKVFKAWEKAVTKKTKGEVQVTWLWNGTAGPEKGVVAKIKSGQLAGGAITGIGLAEIHKPIIALQMPGAFSSWAQLDAARGDLMGDFSAAMGAAGFHLGGFGDVGQGKVMTKGYAVKVPTDLQGRKPGMIADDIIAPKVYEVIGGINAVSSEVTGFLPKLNNGSVDAMNTPALAAEQLQWASRLDHINTATTAFGIGAVVMSKSALDELPADQREVVIETGKKAAEALTRRIRKADDQAFARLKKKMTVHDPSDAERAQWKAVFRQACERLKGAIPGDVLTKIGAC